MEEPVRLRPPPQQFLTLPAVATALFAVTAWLPPHRPQWLLFPLAAVLMFPPARGLLLEQECLVFWRLLGRRRIPWSQITAIEVRTGAVTVTAGHIGQRVTALRPGWVLRDPDFDRKLEVLRRWWAEHRGANRPD